MRISLCIMLVFFVVSAMACSPMVKSMKIASGSGENVIVPAGEGVRIYYLPKSVFHLVLKPKKENTPQNGNAGQSDTSHNDPQHIPQADNPNPTSKPVPQTQGKVGDSSEQAQNNKTPEPSVQQSQTPTPIPLVDIPLTIDAVEYTFTISYSYQPDRKAMYLLQYDASPMANENVQFDTKNGLLDTITMSSEDKTAAILKKMAELSQALFTMGTGVSIGSKSSEATMTAIVGQPEKKLLHIDVYFDPEGLINTEVGLGNEIVALTKITLPNDTLSALNSIKIRIDSDQEQAKATDITAQVGIVNGSETMSPTGGGNTSQAGTPQHQGAATLAAGQANASQTHTADGKKTSAEPEQIKDGIFFRMKIPYNFVMAIDATSPAKTFYINQPVFLTTNSPIFAYNLKRSALVKKEYTLKFEQGFLTSDKIVKPSEMEAAASLPIEIIKQLSSIFTNIFQLRVNYSSEAEAYTAKKKDFEAMRDYLDTVNKMYEDRMQSYITILDNLKSNQATGQ